MTNTNAKNPQNLIFILKSQARREAVWGAYIAGAAIIISTLAVCYISDKTITLSGIVNAQKNNFALLILDFLALFFPFWGQYSSQVLAYEANELFREHSEALISRANRLEKEKTFVSTHDLVTELPNRSLFYDRLETIMRQVGSKSGFQSLYFLQINNLKEITDTLGPTSGDSVIKQLGVRLVKTLDIRDTVARIDSNMFGILDVLSQDDFQCQESIRRLQKAIEPPFEVGGMKISLQVQFGVAYFPEHGNDPDTLIQKVGIAVYMAHKAHNGYAVYSPMFDSASPRSLTLMGDLSHALENEQFELHFQPKLDLMTKKIIGAEALVRWNHPQHGVIYPGDFIKLIERTHMMKTFTQWIIEKSFSEASAWHAEGLSLIISINLSPRDLHDPQLPDRIVGAMARFNVDPKLFIFEITEGSILIDPTRVLAILNRLNSLGFGISIDDFGTGYSSLAYLRRLPVCEIKVDKSFVSDMLSNESDAVIVKATIDLAHNLGLKVTAEGIESEKIMEALKNFGCDLIQGYYISRGLSSSEFRAFLKSSSWGTNQIDLSRSAA